MDFWREEWQRTRRGNENNSSYSQSPLDPWREAWQRMFRNNENNSSSFGTYLQENLEPYSRKLTDCYILQISYGLERRIPPDDFVRIVSGSCSNEEAEYKSVLLRLWTAVYPRDAVRVQSFGSDLIRDRRIKVVSFYTQRWYSNADEWRKQKEAPTNWTGSGFFVTSAGHLLTNAHVAQGCSNPTVRVDGATEMPVNTVALDNKNDLALMKAAFRPKKIASLRVTPPVSVGDPIVVFGFPLSGLLSSSGNATFGNISATMGISDNPDHLQISASVQSGNSGGPLLDSSGNVVGIVFAKLGLRAASLTGDLPQNINFAVKSTIAAKFLADEGIAVEKRETTVELSKAEIVEMARAFSVEIKCAGKQSQAQQNTLAMLQKRSTDFVVNHYGKVSSDNFTMLDYSQKTYAPQVVYFGEKMTRDDVIGKLTAYYGRWPVRKYIVDLRSVNANCDESMGTCKIDGVIDFDAQNPERGQRSSGLARFGYLVRFMDRGQHEIIEENGSVIRRN